MSKRPPRPQGYSWVVPSFVVKDADAAFDFYRRAFGFEKTMAVPGPDGRTAHGEMAYKDIRVMFTPEGAFGCTAKTPAASGVAAPMSLYLYCEDVDAMFARATAAGAKVGMPPQDMFWGDRMCSVIDLDGHTWSFATNIADFDPSKVPH